MTSPDPDPHARPRVVMLLPYVHPARIALYRELTALRDFRVELLFSGRHEPGQPWDPPGELDFPHTVLPGYNCRVPSREILVSWFNPSLMDRIRPRTCALFLGFGWYTLSVLYGYVLCRLRGIPYLVWAGSTRGEPSWRRTLTMPLVRSIVGGAEGCLAYGTRSRDYLVSLGAEAADVALAYNAVDNERCGRYRVGAPPDPEAVASRLRLRDAWGVPREAPVFLFVGQFLPRKGLDVLLEAFGALRDHPRQPHLVIVGYGPLAGELEGRASGPGSDRIHVLGYRTPEDMERIYPASDLLVVPSREEVWGLVVNEGMAAGLGVVITDAAGAGDDLVVEGENGHVVRADDPAALARCLAGLLEEPGALAALGDAAADRIEEFGHARQLTAFTGAISRALARRS